MDDTMKFSKSKVIYEYVDNKQFQWLINQFRSHTHFCIKYFLYFQENRKTSHLLHSEHSHWSSHSFRLLFDHDILRLMPSSGECVRSYIWERIECLLGLLIEIAIIEALWWSFLLKSRWKVHILCLPLLMR